MKRSFFQRSVHEVAPELIGVELAVDGVGGVIVEVEAYDHEDPAGHGYQNRRTARNAAMFLPGGHAYVYRSYGIHWCLNFVCGEAGVASAVLVRALQPTMQSTPPETTEKRIEVRAASTPASTSPRFGALATWANSIPESRPSR